MPAKIKTATLALLIGFFVWLGLSPTVARVVYESILMPRLRCADPIAIGSGECCVRGFTFESGRNHLLQGRYYVHPTSQKLVVYFGGRRSNLAKNSLRAVALLKAGVSVVIFEYRGFGEAPGRATTNSIIEDGLAAYDAAKALGYPPDNIILYGESLGVGVASYVGAKKPSAAMILQSGFGSLEVQIKDMLPPLRIYPSFMFPKQRLSAAKNLADSHPPLLILHGDRDPVVRSKHAQWLASVAGAQTELVILHGADHGEVYERRDWFAAVSRFLRSSPAAIDALSTTAGAAHHCNKTQPTSHCNSS